MSKKTKNQKNTPKRYSKISNALKSYFFTLVYRKEMTIKDVIIDKYIYSQPESVVLTTLQLKPSSET